MGPEAAGLLVAGDVAGASTLLGCGVPARFMEERRFIGHRLRQMRADPGAQQWLVRVIVVRETGEGAGTVGFHGPPDAGGIPEVGYSLEPAFRGRGYATEACRGLFDWALRTHGVHRFRASVRPDNAPSLRVVARLGLRPVGEQLDPVDGLETVHEGDWPPQPGPGPS